MNIKRMVARYKIGQRRRARERADKEVEELTLARNKALREAEIATKVAEAKEHLRWAVEQKTRAEAVIHKGDNGNGSKKPQKAKAKAHQKKAKGIAGRIIKSLRKWAR